MWQHSSARDMGILDKVNQALGLLSQEERMRAGIAETKKERFMGEILMEGINALMGE